jgi:hypothetical protein
MEGNGKLVVVREKETCLAITEGFILLHMGYSPKLITDPALQFEQLEERPDLVLTFWGTRWDCTPNDYAQSSQVFVSACIEKNVPFVVITRETRVVPESVVRFASALIKKPYDVEDFQRAVRTSLT